MLIWLRPRFPLPLESLSRRPSPEAGPQGRKRKLCYIGESSDPSGSARSPNRVPGSGRSRAEPRSLVAASEAFVAIMQIAQVSGRGLPDRVRDRSTPAGGRSGAPKARPLKLWGIRKIGGIKVKGDHGETAREAPPSPPRGEGALRFIDSFLLRHPRFDSAAKGIDPPAKNPAERETGKRSCRSEPCPAAKREDDGDSPLRGR